jgi:hypothetical protein
MRWIQQDMDEMPYVYRTAAAVLRVYCKSEKLSRTECGATRSYERGHGSVQLDGRFVLLSNIVFSAIRKHVLNRVSVGEN